MPVFVYKAKKENAETVAGEVAARDVDEAVELVSGLGLLPVSVQEKGTALAPGAFARSIKPRTVNIFTRQLASLLRSGVPILHALEALVRQSRDARFSVIINDMIRDLGNGRSFAACLADHPGSFSDVYVSLVFAGEESGRLKEMLLSLVAYQQKQEEIAQKVRGALTYPAFMLVVGLGTVFFILSFVMPKISVLFSGMRTALPWPTQVVMGLSAGLRTAWPALVVLVLAGSLAGRFINQSPQARRKIKAFWTGLPFIKDLVIKVDMERFARTLGLLLESGIPILKALEIAVPTLDHEPLRYDLALCQERVAGGAAFGECLRESLHVPDIVAQLIAVGEESGALSAALKDVADTYDQEIAEGTKTATTLLEPLLILVVGLVVGFIVFAMLMPIFQMDMFAQ